MTKAKLPTRCPTMWFGRQGALPPRALQALITNTTSSFAVLDRTYYRARLPRLSSTPLNRQNISSFIANDLHLSLIKIRSTVHNKKKEYKHNSQDLGASNYFKDINLRPFYEVNYKLNGLDTSTFTNPGRYTCTKSVFYWFGIKVGPT